MSMGVGWVIASSKLAPCPGRAAAFFMPLRRAGTVPNAGVCDGPGSAAHHAAKRRRAALRPGHERASPPLRRDLVERHVLVDPDVAGQAEHAFGDDVAP